MATHYYLKRYIDVILEKRLKSMGAVVIVGPKWCGKTTTAEQHSRSELKLQDPDNRAMNLKTADIKPSLLLKGEKPRLIDEWQVAPVLWDAVRTSVDNLNKKGLYILTGSTSIDESKIMHSGTGRISRLVMRPMSLYESGESNGKISLIEMFNTPDLDIDGITSDLTLNDLIFVTCRGGWPNTLNIDDEDEQLYVAYDYVNSICESDVSRVDGVKKNPNKVKALLKSYSRNISTLTSNKTIIKDITSNYEDISEATYYSYIDALTRLFVIDNVPSWSPNIRSKTSIRSVYKKEFIDPSIAVASLGLSPEMLLYDLNTFGFLFETLCIRDLKVYSSQYGGEIAYYHDRYDLEADCVIHLSDGRYALIEFKLGTKEIEKGASNLLKLDSIIKEKIKDGKIKIREPSFLAIITGGQLAYTRQDGVKIIPIGCLR